SSPFIAAPHVFRDRSPATRAPSRVRRLYEFRVSGRRSERRAYSVQELGGFHSLSNDQQVFDRGGTVRLHAHAGVAPALGLAAERWLERLTRTVRVRRAHAQAHFGS